MGIELPPNEQELYRRVDEVLHYIWDPIGVAGVPQARDEYYSYLPEVFSLLKNNADLLKIATYLERVVIDRMGLNGNREHSFEIAELLLDWKDILLKHDACHESQSN